MCVTCIDVYIFELTELFLRLSLWDNSMMNIVNELSFCTSFRGNSLKDPASKAYEQALAPYHGWAIRKAVSAGMYVLPTKEQLLKKLNEDGNKSIINFARYSLFKTLYGKICIHHTHFSFFLSFRGIRESPNANLCLSIRSSNPIHR